jgi:small subunit ribosomal protein S24e
MELKIDSNKENKLLNRKEITFTVDQDNSTVRKDDLTRELCKKLSLNPEATLIVRIDQGFGSKQSSGVAHSYATKEMLDKFEPKHVLARIAKKAAKKAGAEPKAEVPAEEPAPKKAEKEEK